MTLEDKTILEFKKWITAMLSIFVFKNVFMYIYEVLKQYSCITCELSNHLGNVMVVVSDKRKGQDDGTGKVGFYLADVIKATDFYSFGMEMPGRTYNQSGSEYRFGFNGMEKESDITGVDGGHLDFGARIYDSRLGRWLSTDPHEMKYPGISPYNFALDNPIIFIDPDGKDARLIVEGNTITLQTTVFLYGTEAQSADTYNSQLEKLGTSFSYKADDGETYIVKYDINFVNADILNFEPGLNDDVGNNATSQISEVTKDVIKFKEGDNIYKATDQTGGLTIQGGNKSMGSGQFSTVIHEIFHTIGYDERYSTKRGFGINDHPEMKEDVLSNSDYKDQISPIHVEDLVNFAKDKESGVYSVFKEGLEIDNTNNGDTKTSSEDVEKAENKTTSTDKQ